MTNATAHPIGHIALQACIALAALSLSACGGGDGDGTADPLRASGPPARALQTETSGGALTAQPLQQVNTTVAGDQQVRAIGRLAAGGYAVAWRTPADAGTSGQRLAVRQYDANGGATGEEVALAFDLAAHPAAAIAVLSDANVLVAYTDEVLVVDTPSQRTLRRSVMLQRFDASGDPVGQLSEIDFLLYSVYSNPFIIELQQPSIATWDDGSFMVSWKYFSQEPPDIPFFEFRAQRYDAAGQPAGSRRNLAVGAGGWGVQSIQLTPLADGGFLVAKTVLDLGQLSMTFVPLDSAQRTAVIGSAGLPSGSRLLPLLLGGYVLWSHDTAGAYTAILDDDATVAQPSVLAGTGFALAGGGFLVVWTDTFAPAGSPNLLAQRYEASGAALGVPTAAGPAPPTALATSLAGEVGVALAWTTVSAETGADVVTQLLNEPDLSWREQVRACTSALRQLAGAQHGQFMRDCLKVPLLSLPQSPR